MSDSHPDHKPGVYAKGDTVRVADNAAQAVELRFAGFVRQGDEPEVKPDRRALQEKAKELGVNATLQAEELQAEVAKAEASQGGAGS